MVHRERRAAPYGGWLLVAASLAGLVAAGIYTFVDGNGIAYTPGTYLVLISTMLLLGGAMILVFASGRGWLGGILAFLVLLDILGTGLAAYFLMAWVLLALMAVALIGWLVHVFVDRSGRRHRHHLTGTEARA